MIKNLCKIHLSISPDFRMMSYVFTFVIFHRASAFGSNAQNSIPDALRSNIYMSLFVEILILMQQ